MKAPAGAAVQIYVDLRERVLEGDIIQTQTGRAYRVFGVRVQERGKHRGRQHLLCIVRGEDAEADPHARVHTIRWYKRRRRV